MDQTPPTPLDNELVAQAFEGLRGEISLLRRAIEQLTAERHDAPDYADTLDAISKRLEDVCTWACKVSERPGIKLGPRGMGREIAEAAIETRASEHAKLEETTGRIAAAATRIDTTIARSRSLVEQRREIHCNRLAFTIIGMTVWAILPGVIARSLPVSWAVPERIAARTLRTDMWHAGRDMMLKADPRGLHNK